MSIEKQPHDWFFKTIFSQEKNVESFLSIFLPNVYKHIVPNSLKLSDTEKLSKKYKKFFLDIAFDCKIKDSDGNLVDGQVYIVFEHKSYPDKHTPSQIAFYKAVIMEEDEKLSRPYRPIIPIVFYHGEKPWNIPTTIPNKLNEIQDLKPYTHSLSYILFDTSNIEDDVLIEKLYLNTCLISAIYTMKNIFKDLKHLKPILEKLILEDVKDCLYIIIDYTVIVKKDLDTIEKVLEEVGGEEKMMTLTEKWKMEGLKKGLEEGLQQGLQQGLQRGIIEGLRESILYTVELKFGLVPNDFKEKLNNISDVNRLKEIQKKVIFANTLNDIVVE